MRTDEPAGSRGVGAPSEHWVTSDTMSVTGTVSSVLKCGEGVFCPLTGVEDGPAGWGVATSSGVATSLGEWWLGESCVSSPDDR